MENNRLQNQPCLVRLNEMKLVGLPITHPFNGTSEILKQARERFEERRTEIQNVQNPERYICAHFNSEVIFTYCFCMEVSEFGELPEGMISFTIPAHRYGAIRCDGDPYESIHSYLNNHGIINNPKALALEVYHFANPKFPEEVDVYIPTHE